MSSNLHAAAAGAFDGVLAAAAPAVDSLALPALRAYRQALRAEEDRASYWRRLVHARLDLLEEGRTTAGSITLEGLVRVLGDTGTGAGRQGLLRVQAGAPLPELPDLVEVWTTPTTPEEHIDAVDRLRAAEHQLTAYRTALLARVEQATCALIRRYRVDPRAALAVIA